MKTFRAITRIAAVTAALFPLWTSNLRAGSGTPDAAARSRIDSSYGKLPLQFEANQGQQPAPVRFLSRGKDYTVFLTPDGALLSLRKLRQQVRIDKPGPAVQEPQMEASADLRLKLEGGNPAVQLTGADPLPGAVNYFYGKDPAKWRTNVTTYSKVRYEQVYPGIDLVFYGNQRQLEYDFVLSPGSTPDAIRLSVEGAERTSVDPATGDLVLQAAGEQIRFHKPVVYQPDADGHPRQEVDGRFQVDKNQVTFEVASYDHARALVVDPVLAYSTFLGGSGEDVAIAVAVDKSGNAYVAGYTCSTNFPTTAGSYRPTQPVQGPNTGCTGIGTNSGSDVFVAKLNAAGTALVYSTYLGGSYYDSPVGIAVDAAGDAYVAGATESFDFPVTNGSVCAPQGYNSNTTPGQCTAAIRPSCGDPSNGGDTSGFITKLNPAGSALLWSTFIGGTGGDYINAMTLDSSGNVYVAATTSSEPGFGDLYCPDIQTSFPWQTTVSAYLTADPLQGWQTPTHSAFSKLSADGSTLMYSTLFGAPRTSSGSRAYFTSIAVDSAGKAYLGGATDVPSFPTTPGAYQTVCAGCLNNNNENGFILSFDPSQSGLASLVFSTFLGGNGLAPNGAGCVYQDSVLAIALDRSDNIYVTGSACSADFPTTARAYQKTNPKPNAYDCNTGNAFLAKLNSSGSTLDDSTFLNGTSCFGQAIGYGISVDSADNAYITGSTNDATFPALNPLQGFGSTPETFVTELNKTASQLLFSTDLGCCGDAGYGIHADNYGNVYVVGTTSGVSLLTTPGAVQTVFGGGGTDGFVTRIALTQADLSVTNGAPATVLTGTHLTYTIVVTNNGPNTADVITLTDSVPKGTTFVSAATSSGSCKTPAVGATSGRVTCTATSLANGIAFTVNMVVDVTAKSGHAVTDTASVSSLVFDPIATNNSATATTTVN
jgi:uncharacterized repeat protein (TIGR01451 family)